MAAGAVIALVAAGFTLWRAPRRTAPAAVDLPVATSSAPVEAGPDERRPTERVA
jgi:hypothetical protein